MYLKNNLELRNIKNSKKKNLTLNLPKLPPPSFSLLPIYLCAFLSSIKSQSQKKYTENFFERKSSEEKLSEISLGQLSVQLFFPLQFSSCNLLSRGHHIRYLLRASVFKCVSKCYFALQYGNVESPRTLFLLGEFFGLQISFRVFECPHFFTPFMVHMGASFCDVQLSAKGTS